MFKKVHLATRIRGSKLTAADLRTKQLGKVKLVGINFYKAFSILGRVLRKGECTYSFVIEDIDRY